MAGLLLFGHLGKSLPSFDKALFGVFGYILTGVSSIASAIMYESYYSSLGLDDNEYRTAIMLENGNLLATTAAALLVAGILTSTGVGAPIGVVIVAVVGASIVVDYFYDKIVLFKTNLDIKRFRTFLLMGNFLFDIGDLLTNIYKVKTIFIKDQKVFIEDIIKTFNCKYTQIQVDQDLLDSVFSDKHKVLKRYNLNVLQLSIFSLLSLIYSIAFILVLVYFESIYSDFLFFFASFLLKGITTGGINMHLRLRHLKTILEDNDILGYLIYQQYMLNGLYYNTFIILPKLDQFILKNMKIIDNIISISEGSILFLKLSTEGDIELVQ